MFTSTYGKVRNNITIIQKQENIIRIHVPLKTSLNVHFYLWEGKEQHHYNLETGKYYYTDVSKPHAVHNKADFDRLHLVVDCYNNPKIKSLLDDDRLNTMVGVDI